MTASRRHDRGLSFVSVILLVLLAGAVWWSMTYGGAYLDNISIKTDLREAAYLSMKRPDDDVRGFIMRKLSAYPNLDVTPEDLRLEKTDNGNTVILDLTYRRRVKPLFLDDERVVVFTRHMEQDISPVKWK